LWVMAKSWTKPWTIAYEIKTSRQDFLRDEKWRNYLPYCNYLYFAVPLGVIDPSELADDVGLIVGSKNLKRLHTKKKAPYRQVDVPEALWRYILMWRAQIRKEDTWNTADQKQFWQLWLEGKKNDKDLGYRVSQKLSQTIRTRIDNVAKENQQLKWQVDRLKRQLKEQRLGVPSGAVQSIDYSIESLIRLKKTLNKET